MSTPSRALIVAASVAFAACRPAQPSPAAHPAAGEPTDVAATTVVRMDGYGELRFGMDLASVERVLGSPLELPSEGCHMVSPASAGTPARFTLMIVDGVLARIDVGGDAIAASGGARVGSDAEALRRLYPDAIEGPSKYDPSGHTWVVGPTSAAHYVFELDGSDRVVQWRAGLPPQVDWVERCG